MVGELWPRRKIDQVPSKGQCEMSYDSTQVDVFFGADYWCGFTPPGCSNHLPPDHGAWRPHARWTIYNDYPFNRIFPEEEIRAGIEKHGFHQCQLSKDQIDWLFDRDPTNESVSQGG